MVNQIHKKTINDYQMHEDRQKVDDSKIDDRQLDGERNKKRGRT